MTPVETFKHAGQTISIYRDDDVQSPQEYGDNGLFLVGLHRQFYVMPPGEKGRIDFEEVCERYKATHWILPLEAYIHGGVVLALSHEGNFPDRQWDVSQLGAVFVSKKEMRLSKSARKAALSLVKTWNQYLSGDVYGYVIGDERSDSCWGFYGLEYCKKEAMSIAEHIQTRQIKDRLAKVKAWILNRVPLSKRVSAAS